MNVSSQLTQGQLDYLFTQLGYHLSESEKGPRVWSNSEYDAVMLLPMIPPEQPARLHHLMTLRRIAIEKGIVKPEEFEALLEKARKQQVEPIASHSVA